jgi:hypothetical protein
MPNFFSKFPYVEYVIDDTGNSILLTDIMRNVDVNDALLDDNSQYTFYDISDGDRPDVVSEKLYGTTQYYWTFFIVNNDLRAGLNAAWPLSLNQLDEMITREYTSHSAISFLPISETNNGKSDIGLISLCKLHKQYLPYLRLTDSLFEAKILKYDATLCQLIINDIRNSDGTAATSRDYFVNDPRQYKLVWKNPYEIDSDAWMSNQTLMHQYVEEMYLIYNEFDKGSNIDPDYYDEILDPDLVRSYVLSQKSNYIFSKTYEPCSNKYRWASYADAASEYYEIIDDINVPKSAIDIISNPNIVTPKYISFSEREYLINSQKEKIRVIDPSRISDFVSEYFRLINV